MDLTTANTAELSFWTWYHIEEDWDYAYVSVGTTASGVIPADLSDPSVSWRLLTDRRLGCTTSDPNNANLGCALTGLTQDWEKLGADLSDYVGRRSPYGLSTLRTAQ